MTRKLRADAVLVQAVIAGALSFSHLHDLAEAAGQTGWKAWAYPVSVDLLLVASWRRMSQDADNRDAWMWFTIALTASLGANVSTAGLLDLGAVPPWLRILVAGWPALAFLGGTLLAHKPAPPAAPEPEPAPVPEPRTVLECDPAPADAPADPEPVTDEPEEIEAPEPAPALAAAPAPAPPVPVALVAHARKVADDHRARTGAAIDTDTLRARLGVPAPMADAIAAQLT
ncbi:DUF2637 domain-containing protein [Streptomyces chilikensis]|uniref:DUF2637 domain-containing protein n=1 Tax=Streptomyces chilikensis TaxID=1194079 RepID=A0ABV3ESE9_9ACTN